MAKKKPTKKRNPQDATRKRDVDPLRRRIKKFEGALKALEARLHDLETNVAIGGNDEGGS